MEHDTDNDDQDNDLHDGHDVHAIDPDVNIEGVYDYENEDGGNPNDDNPNEPMVPEPVDNEDNGNNEGGRDGTESVEPLQLPLKTIEETIAETDDETELVDNPQPMLPIDANVDKNYEADDDDHVIVKVRPGIEQYNLRAQRPTDYSYLHTTLAHTATTQFTMRKESRRLGRQVSMPC
jgi:hypothetical protein